ncbi:MAG: hypothetical protein M3276_01835 [Actinomycetota bacterium]|nr:hypothetical protein [Actinomycetota bacterium]
MRRNLAWAFAPVAPAKMIRRALTAALVALIAAALVAVPEHPLAAQGHGEGVWEVTTPLSVPRYDHTTTLLAGGKVLVAAGRAVIPEQPVELLTSAELFDPHSERWLPTGSLVEARWRHTATVLRDGRVLVAGGFGDPYRPGSNAQPVLDTAELYDPRTGTWSPTGSMNARRALHVATLLPNGQVLVAGGRTCNQPPPEACNFTFVTNTAELYDPATGTWSSTGPLVEPRHTTSTTLLVDGKVLIPAGFVGGGAPSRTADLYDPATGTSALTGNLNRARARQGAMQLHDGRVLVASGFQGGNTSEFYDPGPQTWSLTGNLLLPTARFNFNFAVLPNGKALVAGGATFPPASRPLSAELFNPATGQWTAAAEMNDEHGSSSSLANSDRAVVLSSNPWRFEARPGGCAPNCGKVLVAGNSPTGTVELYTPTCPLTLPRPPQQLSCVRDGPGNGRSGAPGTPGEPGPPEWLGTPGAADRHEAEIE